MSDEKIRIGGFIDFTTLDWPGKIASVIFFHGCNYRCPFCFNGDFVVGKKFTNMDIEEILAAFLKNKDFVDHVVICGGEPTLQSEGLIKLCRALKQNGFKIKLDTNGSNPSVIKKITNERLVDYIAMDIKATFDENYKRATGQTGIPTDVKKSLEIISKSGIDYECRIPVVPSINMELVPKIAEQLKSAKTVVLEQFIPDNALDGRLRASRSPTREELMELALNFKNPCIKIRTREAGEETIQTASKEA